MGKICCFAGHGKLNYGSDVKNQIFSKCRELITEFCVDEFWVGNYGSFDRLSANVVRTLKKEYPDIELNLIIPYVTKSINIDKERYYKNYDNIFVADIPENTPTRYRIIMCNQYMIDNSKYLVAFVNHHFGGASKTLEYAEQKKNIEVFNFGGLSD